MKKQHNVISIIFENINASKDAIVIHTILFELNIFV